MSENTKIEWTDSTFNPWWGCTKISPACDNCYAQALDKRTGGEHWGPGAERRRTSIKNWNDPIRWNKNAAAFFAEHGRRQRVFCASMADVFDNAVDQQWRADLFTLIAATPNLDWLLLTKRIGNVYGMVPLKWIGSSLRGRGGVVVHHAGWPENVWLGATICNQAEADRDIQKLLAVPAHKRFLSMEPLLGAVDLTSYLWGRATPCADCPKDADCDCGFMPRNEMPDEPQIDWVIVGGESGPNARPMHPDWARSLQNQCEAAGVPYLFKQWGNWISADQDECPRGGPFKDWMWADGTPFMPGDGQRRMPLFRKVSKQTAGRLLDGREWNGAPA